MLHIIQYILFVLSYVVEFYHDMPNRIGLFTIIIVSIVYRLYFKTMKNLFYTFWTFSVFILLFLLYKIVSLLPVPGSESAMLIYFLISILLLVECYFLSSPIYYPLVNWWEYDFRYRADIKVFIKAFTKDTDLIQSRLSDVRRQACCLSVFEDLDIGKGYTLLLPDNLSFQIEIMSKRQYSLGRPKTYGIRFLLSDPDDKKKYLSFEKEWNEHKYNKKKMKFVKSEIS